MSRSLWYICREQCYPSRGRVEFNQAQVNGGSNYDSLKVAKCLVIQLEMRMDGWSEGGTGARSQLLVRCPRRSGVGEGSRPLGCLKKAERR